MRISGGADEAVTAAIAAVVAKVLADEIAARATPPVRPRQSDWAVAWRRRNMSSAGRVPPKSRSWSDRNEKSD